MRVKNIYWLLLLCMLFASCASGQNKKSEGKNVPLTGNDKDKHGCIASAGYTWSEVQKDCIRLWEKGVRVESVSNSTNTAYIIFSPDSLRVELFFSDNQPNVILDRRTLPADGYAWNVEDDDTKNVRLENGGWTISQRGNLLYKQVKAEK